MSVSCAHTYLHFTVQLYSSSKSYFRKYKKLLKAMHLVGLVNACECSVRGPGPVPMSDKYFYVGVGSVVAFLHFGLKTIILTIAIPFAVLFLLVYINASDQIYQGIKKTTYGKLNILKPLTSKCY